MSQTYDIYFISQNQHSEKLNFYDNFAIEAKKEQTNSLDNLRIELSN